MRFALIVLCLVGCSKKSEPSPNAGSAGGSAAAPAGSAMGSESAPPAGSAMGAGSASPAGSAAGSASEAPTGSAGSSAPAAGSAAGSASAQAAGAGSAAQASAADAASVCCCESTGDATHYTIEGDPAACTADDMNGTCVDLKECELDKAPQRLATGIAVTVDAAGLLAIWKTKEEKAFAAVEIKPAGANATVRTTGDNRPEAWTKQGSIPTAPGPLTVTGQADGTAVISNGATRWVLAQDYRYGKITFKKQK